MRSGIAAAVMCVLLLGCTTTSTEPTGGAVSDSGRQSGVIGTNSVGERCSQQVDSSHSASIYCGDWEQPSARISSGGPGSADSLTTLATSSPWRTELNSRFVCNDPVRTTLLGSQPSVLMQCTRRVGGWPHVAVVTLVDGNVWYIDGVDAAVPVMARSLSIMSGTASAEHPTRQLPGADALLATRLAAQAMKSGDIGEYEHLMAAGTRANLADSPAAAERAFRAALTLQQKALGADNPNTADPMMLVALQLSNQGKYAQAEPLFARAEQLAQKSADPAAIPRLLHYRGLHELNQDHPDRALTYFDRAEAGYTALVPPNLLSGHNAASPRVASFGNLADLLPDRQLLVDPVVQSSLLGIIEVRRNRAIALKEAGRDDDAAASLISAADLSRANDLALPIVTSRLYRTQGILDENLGQQSSALSRLSLSSDSFTRALPGSRSYAITGLLQAAQAERSRGAEAALPLCRDALHLLRELHAGTSGDLLMPCLDAFASEAQHQPDQEQALRDEMFEAAQLAQSSVTTQQIAQASARLLEGARDPHVAEAIRKQQEAVQNLSDLYRQRSELATAAPDQPGPRVDAAELAKRIAAAEQVQAEADSDLQAAAPGYGQLVQEVASAQSVLQSLRSRELLVSVVLGNSAGWTFALRDGRVELGHIDGGLDRVSTLVKRIRATVEPSASGALPDFDVGAAQELYGDLFGGVAKSMDGASSLVVAPTGPLLSIPFALLLTASADPHRLGEAPWLVRRMAIAHVPAPANFVSLRKVAGTSRAARSWFGFGDFEPIPLALAERSFPEASCAQSARELASLGRLPFAGRELEAARQLLGAGVSDELTGRAYTAAAVQRVGLSNYKIVHFASHALLPSELKCESEPAIVTSAPPGAKDASGALLTASQVAALHLDADAIILSACNSGGPGGAGGESLSGLARAFFFAGARSMLVTHWSVNDQTSAFLVADTLRRYTSQPSAGMEEALRQSQLTLLQGAATSHPFYWAPFALIGEGRTTPAGNAGPQAIDKRQVGPLARSGAT